MRTSDNMKGTLADIASLVKDEFKTISTSYAILLVLVGGIFLYGLLYNYMYAPDLVRNAPVVVRLEPGVHPFAERHSASLGNRRWFGLRRGAGVDEGGGCRRYLVSSL